MVHRAADLTAGPGEPTDRGGLVGLITRQRTKPLIAAVEGFAVDGGMELVLCCDVVVAATNARFGLPEVKRGLMADFGGAFRIATALALAERICTNAPLAVRAELANSALVTRPDETERWRHSDATHEGLLATEDFSEGLGAFFERRTPTWHAPLTITYRSPSTPDENHQPGDVR